jgi:ADP-ribose pyrophosphatase YjhB (NUDIX family)
MNQPDIKHFNVRVYALIMNDAGQILLSDEYMLDRKMTKFPGGGMHFGEGPADCIKREAMEEFGQEIEITGHFYTTHFFQRALFYSDHQLISIYYRAKFKEPPRFAISGVAFDFPALVNGSQSFRWTDLETLTENELSFPIDRFVLNLLKNPHALQL